MPHQDNDPITQPLLPRISITWFFYFAAVVAMALFVVRAADQGQSLAMAMVFGVIFLGLTAIVSAICFLCAFTLGAIEQAVTGENEEVGSPFIDGKPPEQIIPPDSTNST